MNFWHQAVKGVSDYFDISRSQARAWWILMVLAVIFTSLSLYFQPDQGLSKSKQEVLDKMIADASKPNVPLTLKPFDPNQSSTEEWKKRGTPDWLAQRITKYVSKGGTFRSKKDLQKIYGLPDSLYLLWEPYLVFSTPQHKKPEEKNSATKPTQIALNSCDSSTAARVLKIPMYLAKRICVYRDKLGGFVHILQLREVYGLNENTYNRIVPIITLDTSSIQKIYINSSDFKLLNKHPYLEYEDVKKIFTHKRKYGPIEDASILSEVIGKEKADKVLPYLLFEEGVN